jgi:hypothetical protein
MSDRTKPTTDPWIRRETAPLAQLRSGRRLGWLASFLLISALLVTGALLAAWKVDTIRESDAAAASQPEPVESVEVAVATPREHRPTTTSIGTVLATRSVTLRNELSGTVREVSLTPGQFSTAFSRHVGQPPSRYATSLRTSARRR